MNKVKSRLEDLPNELLTDIFKLLDGRNLFRAFYNLNSRLNHLLKSFQYLQLIFHVDPTNISKPNDEIFPFYIHTLIVKSWFDFNLKYFPNVRYLKLNDPLPNLLEQVKSNIMPHLEYLSISYKYNMYEIDLLHKRIFSNHFIYLKSYEYSFEKDTLMTILDSTRSPSIHLLKIEFIDLSVYKTILSTCPNLCFFKFWLLPSNGLMTNIQLHNNLKRMIIELKHSEWFIEDNLINEYFSCVPNLKELEIHRRNYTKNILEYLEDYDWLQPSVSFHFPMLRKFKFYFHVSTHKDLMETTDKKMLIQSEKNFLNVHKSHYKAQLIID